MSDNMNMDVRIGTTADTAGIAKAEAAISPMEERAKRLQLAIDKAKKADAKNENELALAQKRLAQNEEALAQRRQKLSSEREASQRKIDLTEQRIALEAKKADDAKEARQKKIDLAAQKIVDERAKAQARLAQGEKRIEEAAQYRQDVKARAADTGIVDGKRPSAASCVRKTNSLSINSGSTTWLSGRMRSSATKVGSKRISVYRTSPVSAISSRRSACSTRASSIASRLLAPSMTVSA